MTAKDTVVRAKFSNPLTEVRMEPLSINGDQIDRFGIQVLDDEGRWQTQSIVSKEYQLVKNSLALQVADDVISRSPNDWSHVRTIWNGKLLSSMYQSDLIVEIPKVGDAMALGLRIENSYDGSVKLRASLMAFILSCTNGVMHPREFGSFTFKHDANQQFDIEDVCMQLTTGAGVLSMIAPRLGSLGGMKLETNHIVAAANRLAMPKANFVDALKALVSKPTAWDFMQALTYQATHEISGVSSLAHSQAVGELFLDDFAVVA